MEESVKLCVNRSRESAIIAAPPTLIYLSLFVSSEYSN